MAEYYNYIDSPLSAGNTIRMLAKHKKLLITIFVSIMATVIVAMFVMSPEYKASSKVLVEWDRNNEKAMLFRLNGLNGRLDYDRMASEIEIIKSRPIAAGVVDDLKLYATGEDSSEFLRDRQLAEIREEAIEKLQRSIKVNRAKDANIVEIAYEDKDPALSALVVNHVVENYIKHRAELFKNTHAYKFFDDQIKLTAEKLDKLEADEARFLQQQRVIKPEEQSLILLKKIGDFEQALTQVRTERIGKEARLRIIKEQMVKGGDAIIPATESSNSTSRERYLSDLKSRLAQLEVELGALLTQYKPSYHLVHRKNVEIEVIRKKISAEVEQVMREEDAGIHALVAEEQEYERKISELTKQMNDLAVKRFKVEKLARGIDDNREVYSMLMKQREEARISMAKQDQVSQVKILSAAVVPFRPAKPNRPLLLTLGLLVAIVASFGTVGFIDYYDRTVKSVDDVQKCLDLPVLASVEEVKQPNGRHHDYMEPNGNPGREGDIPDAVNQWVNPLEEVNA